MRLRIEKAVYGGDGMARIPAPEGSAGGKAIFLRETLPGELVEAHVTGDRRGYSYGEADTILEPSPDRIAPGCEYFSRCGGCQYQHASPAAQIQMKLDILRETFERAHVSGIGEIHAIASPPWGYRNRIRLQIKRLPPESGAKFALGYRERASHTDLPVTHCPIAAPVLEAAMQAFLSVSNGSRGCAGFLDRCDQIEFFTNGAEDSMLVTLFTSSPHLEGRSAGSGLTGLTDLTAFAEELRARAPSLVGAALMRSASPSRSPQKNAGADGTVLAQWGERSLVYRVRERGFQVSLGSFFQVNRFLVDTLQELAAGAKSGGTAWDLYAGAGLFAAALNFDTVTAVESSPSAAADLAANLASSGRRAIRSSTADFLRRGPAGPKPDLILLDPPRAGLGREIAARVAQFAAGNIVYVSCDPATLARDIQALSAFGYRVRSVQMLDLFPQTFHLESVVVLDRE